MDFKLDPPVAVARRTPRAALDEQTEAALRTRMVIGQAVGILMLRHRLTSDAAFARLVEDSQRTNTKLREIARRLVEQLDEANRPR